MLSWPLQGKDPTKIMNASIAWMDDSASCIAANSIINIQTSNKLAAEYNKSVA
jgi:hypothetical protein